MPDIKYCYPNSDVLKNKLNIKGAGELFSAEVKLTALRLQELEANPIIGNFDFLHLKAIHQYIFQDLYDWAGEVRTVEIGKGNIFCTTRFIEAYAESVFAKYYPECCAAKYDIEKFVIAFANNYGDLNALHPFREGNGRAQREFARILCLQCGYDFSLTCTTHREMLNASKRSFDKADNSGLIEIFKKAVQPLKANKKNVHSQLSVLTSDDLDISGEPYDYYTDEGNSQYRLYDALFESKIKKMKAEDDIRTILASIHYDEESDV